MHTLYIDADACPVQAEALRVAKRYAWPVFVVANRVRPVPDDPAVTMVVEQGFGVVDDWIAERAGPGDIVVTGDIPLAARCVNKGAFVLTPKGTALDDSRVGEALASRDLGEGLRQMGERTRGPSAMTPKDRSRFLGALDTAIVAAKKSHKP